MTKLSFRKRKLVGSIPKGAGLQVLSLGRRSGKRFGWSLILLDRRGGWNCGWRLIIWETAEQEKGRKQGIEMGGAPRKSER